MEESMYVINTELTPDVARANGKEAAEAYAFEEAITEEPMNPYNPVWYPELNKAWQDAYDEFMDDLEVEFVNDNSQNVCVLYAGFFSKEQD
jgi:hypothetical protein